MAAPFGGIWVGAWITCAVPLAAWVMLRHPPHPSLPAASDAVIMPVAALSALAAHVGRDGPRGPLPVAITVAAYGVALVGTHYAHHLERFTSRIGRSAASVVTNLSFLTLGLFVVVVPWAVQRLAVVDPLATGSRQRSGWVARSRNEVRPTSPWSATKGLKVRRPLQRLRLAVVSALVAAAIALGVFAGSDPPIILDEPPQRPAAYADAAWWPDYLDQMTWALFKPGPAFNPLRYPAMREVHTPYINIDRGERRSWSPPPCACDPVVVWLYGASTMFGMGQRDDNTIPSKLAKIAERHGITLEVHNRGVLGDLHWEESQRFAWDVESGEVPDVVVFYSGYNDIVGTEYRDNLGHGLDGTPVDWTAENSFERGAFDPFGVAKRWLSGIPDDWTVPPLPEVDRMEPAALGTYVANQYLKSRLVGVDAAKRHGVAATWFWQPTLYTRPAVTNEPQSEPNFDRYQRSAFAAASLGLPSEIVDLSSLFNQDDRVIYYDDVHTNELGAHLVAQAMFDRIRNDLDAVNNG